ncbi:hypothetical protein FKP32DRAFT_1449332 [Trametes sanguinea]|nr:hypothetical protein FKP32DRAFT_1449332 [Trametes sanguinea]
MSSAHPVPRLHAMPHRPPSPVPLPPLDVRSSPAAMADAVFPIEICERIMGFWDSKHVPGRYASLKAFTLVCRAWLPFALYRLYMNVLLTKSRNCFILLDVVSRYPHRAAWVDSLRFLEDLENAQYLPVGLLIVPTLFTKCRSVELGDLRRLGWRCLDRIVVPLLGQHHSVTALDLRSMQLFSWDLLARLFRAMPQLQRLTLPRNRSSRSSRARAGRKPFLCCPDLRHLSMTIRTEDVRMFTPLAPGWFGCTALEELRLFFHSELNTVES